MGEIDLTLNYLIDLKIDEKKSIAAIALIIAASGIGLVFALIFTIAWIRRRNLATNNPPVQGINTILFSMLLSILFR